MKEAIHLRQRPRANGIKALFLDICRDGRRKTEYLKLYIIPEHTREDKQRNRQTMQLAESIRAKRIVELQSQAYGVSLTSRKDSAIVYDVLEGYAADKKQSTRDIWRWCIALMRSYDRRERLRFSDITPDWISGFREHLNHCKARDGHLYSLGTRATLFNALRAMLNRAVRDGIIDASPIAHIAGYHREDSMREYLTIEEMQAMAQVPYKQDSVRRAFLFSCLTGLRLSDIEKLTWSEVMNTQGLTRIVFRQKKTRTIEHLTINEQAAALLGERGNDGDKVFILPSRVNISYNIRKWTAAAGINKHITFHSARHTFATMMLTLGVDIYTVSKLLGHRNIATTQIYAKIIDKKKEEAVLLIPDIFSR